ncbi:MAG: hypothetical protein WEA04_01675 [Candidatus Andersenbacteria bacterium]
MRRAGLRKRVLGTAWLVATTLYLLTPPAQAVQVPPDSLPPARVVAEDRSTLTQQGCIEQVVTENMVDVPPGKPYRVAAADRLPGTLFFCDPQVTAQLTITQGQVEGALLNAFCASLGGIVGGPLGAGLGFLGCQVGEVVVNKVGAAVGETVAGWAIDAIQTLLNFIAGLGLWVLARALELVQWTLGANQFITNPLVIAGWPFIQGLANMGFILALLFIAFSTTLGIENMGARRMLPRLLLAAILINFSLIISGVIIDLTKVLMAIMATTLSLGGFSLNTVMAFLQQNSRLLEITALPFDTEGLSAATLALVQIATTALLIWILAIAVIWLAIGLIIRYVILVFLLIISPLAYLAFAFPNAGGLASRWWREFFKYVFYGPVALFFLLIAAQINSLGSIALFGGSSSILQDLLLWALMVAMIFAAAIFSKQVGGTVGVMAVNFVNNRTKQLGRGGRWVGQKAAGAAYKRSGIKDFVDERKKYNEKQEQKRSKTSLGRRVGQDFYASPKKRAETAQARQAAEDVKKAGGGAPANHPVFTPRNLRSEEVGRALSSQQISTIIAQPPSADKYKQVSAMVQNIEIVNNMTAAHKDDIIDELQDLLMTPHVPGAGPAAVADHEQAKKTAQQILNEFHATRRRAGEQGSEKK